MRSNYVSATPPATRDTRTLRLLGALLLFAGLVFAQNASKHAADRAMADAAPVGSMVTPDPDARYWDDLRAWTFDTRAWADAWVTLMTTTPPDSPAWVDGHAKVLRDGADLAARLDALAVPADRADLHGQVRSTFGACLDGAQAMADGQIGIGKLSVAVCTGGFAILAANLDSER